MNAPGFLLTLDNLGKQIHRWRLLQTGITSSFSLFFTIAFLQLLAHFLPLSELVIVTLAIVLGLALVSAISVRIYQVARNKPDLIILSRRVERSYPELYDHLNCAVDICQRHNQSSLTPEPMEEMVIARADDLVKNIDIYELAGYDKDQRRALLAALLISGMLLFSASQWSITTNLYSVLKERLGGESTALIISPGSGQYAEHSDITINASPRRRWRNTPFQAQIEYETDNESHVTDMYPSEQGGDAANFTFFNALSSIKYRVISRDHVSEWHHLNIFQLPSIEHINWTIQPPAYTALPVIEATDLRHINIPENSSVSVQLAASTGLQVQMFKPGQAVELSPSSEIKGIYQHQWKQGVNTTNELGEAHSTESSIDSSNKETSYDIHFRLTNSENRWLESETIKATVIPDKEPTLEIVNPGVDVSLFPDQGLPLDIYTADDYGISRVILHVQIKDKKYTYPLAINGIQKEQQLQYKLSAKAINAREGDLVSYYLSATDNRVPIPQTSNSELFFIEIESRREDKADSDISADTASQNADNRELPIREYIVRTKKIIRDSFKTLNMPSGQRHSEGINDISQETLSLKQEMNRTYVDSKHMFKEVDGVDTAALLENAVNALTESLVRLDQRQLNPALEQSSLALQQLVKLNTLLRKLAASQAKKAGTLGSMGDGQPTNTLSQIQQQSNYEKRAKKIMAIRDALKKTREFIQQQEAINIRIEKADTLSGTMQISMTEKQQQLASETRSLGRSFYDSTGSLGPSSHLQLAHEEMVAAHAQMVKQQVINATPMATRALESLQMAAVSLKQALYSQTSEMLEQAKRQGEQLAKWQNQTMQKTLASNNAEQMETEQEKINQQTNQYTKELHRSSRLLEDMEEKTSEAYRELSNNQRQRALNSQQERALNALRYELFGEAGKAQQQIANNLKEITAGLVGVQQQLAMDKGNVLAGTLQRMDATLKNIDSVSSGELQQLAEQIKSQLQRDDITNTDFRLKEAIDLYNDLAQRTDSTYLKEDMSWALEQTIPVLQKQLWERALRQSIEKSQERAPLPAQYRRAVEDYFRRLAEDPGSEAL